MRRTRLGVLSVLIGAALAVGIVVLLSVRGAGSSVAQQGLMHNCPEPGMWAISVWAGDDGISTDEALGSCGEGTVAAAYSIDPSTQDWLRWFPGRPEVSDLLALDNLQGVVALGAASSATPTATPSTSVTPLVTEKPTATPAESAAPGGTHTPTLTPTGTATPYSDRDGDGIGDMSDNCPFDANPEQEDTYCTALGDACDCSFHDGICWYAGGTVLVGFEEGTSYERAQEIVDTVGAPVSEWFGWGDCSVRVPDGQELRYIQMFAGFEEVSFADLNHVFEVDF